MYKFGIIIFVLLLMPSASAESAEDIAQNNLRSLYREEGIFAGPNQFSDYWARDALFATLGSNAIGDYDISKKQLDLFIKYQKSNGQIPMRYGDYDITLKLFGINLNQIDKPRYDQDKLFSYPRDQNCLFVIAAEDYVLTSGDVRFAKDNFESFEQAIRWLAEEDDNGNFLIEEGNYGGWTDSVKKNGEVLYTNACYYKSLKSISNLASITNQPAKSQIYAMWAKIVQSKINDEMWLESGYYADWISGNTKYTYFSTDGNVLAIIWGVANDSQAKSILSYSENLGLSDEFGVRTTYPDYSYSKVSPVNIIAGIPDYHSNVRWLWVSCLYAKALEDNEFNQRSANEFSEIKNSIVSLGEVYESYEPNGEPIDRLFYKSEHTFAWSSGVCTWVFKNR